MENRPTTLKRRLSRVPVFTVLACLLVAVAFTHVNVIGIYVDRPEFRGTLSYADLPDGPGQYLVKADDWSWFYGFQHGWPIPFGIHEASTKCDSDPHGMAPEPPPLPRHMIPFKWIPFHVGAWRGALCDLLLSMVLLVATGIAILRLERRRGTCLQFSLADVFSLIAATSMVLGLVCLDGRFSLGDSSLVEGSFVRLRDLPLFDSGMILLAIACAVWLIVSTGIDRLGNRRATELHEEKSNVLEDF